MQTPMQHTRIQLSSAAHIERWARAPAAVAQRAVVASRDIRAGETVLVEPALAYVTRDAIQAVAQVALDELDLLRANTGRDLVDPSPIDDTFERVAERAWLFAALCALLARLTPLQLEWLDALTPHTSDANSVESDAATAAASLSPVDTFIDKLTRETERRVMQSNRVGALESDKASSSSSSSSAVIEEADSTASVAASSASPLSDQLTKLAIGTVAAGTVVESHDARTRLRLLKLRRNVFTANLDHQTGERFQNEAEIHGRGMFPFAAQMNHACAPNCSAVCIPIAATSATSTSTSSSSSPPPVYSAYVRVVATRDITAGTELTRAYTDTLGNDKEQRARELRARHGIDACVCDACTHDRPVRALKRDADDADALSRVMATHCAWCASDLDPFESRMWCNDACRVACRARHPTAAFHDAPFVWDSAEQHAHIDAYREAMRGVVRRATAEEIRIARDTCAMHDDVKTLVALRVQHLRS
jgi:hypothetical protein